MTSETSSNEFGDGHRHGVLAHQVWAVPTITGKDHRSWEWRVVLVALELHPRTKWWQGSLHHPKQLGQWWCKIISIINCPCSGPTKEIWSKTMQAWFGEALCAIMCANLGQSVLQACISFGFVWKQGIHIPSIGLSNKWCWLYFPLHTHILVSYKWVISPYLHFLLGSQFFVPWLPPLVAWLVAIARFANKVLHPDCREKRIPYFPWEHVASFWCFLSRPQQRLILTSWEGGRIGLDLRFLRTLE